MKRKIKGLFSFLIAISIVISSFVVPAYAATATETIFSNNTYSTQGIRSVDYVEDIGMYVATGGSAVYTSADGYMWSRRGELDWNGGLAVAGFAYGNDHAIIADGSASGSFRAIVTDKYLNESWAATMVVEHESTDANVLTDANGNSYRYLKIKPKIYFDKATEKFYCFGIENTANGTWVDWGFYSTDGTIENVETNMYGNNNTSAIKWTKVNLGAADPYAGKTVSDKAHYSTFQVDGNGRMIFSVETGTVGFWSNNYYGETVLVDLKTGKALNIINKRTISPLSGMDKAGNYVIIGVGYGNNSSNITAYGGAFDTAIATNCATENTKKITLDTTWAQAQQTSGAVGTNAAGTEVKMNARPRKFVGLDSGIMMIPNGAATIAAGKENDLKVYLPNESGVLDGNSKYKTVVNNADKLATILGNGGTARTVIDVCAGPNGQVVLATAVVTDTVKNTSSNLVTLETSDISYTADNGSKATIVTTASKDYGAVKNIVAEKTDLIVGETTTLKATVVDGARATVANPELTYTVISKDEALGFDAETGVITAPDVSGAYSLTVKASSTHEPSVYSVKTITFNVSTPIVTTLTVNGTEYDVQLASELVIANLTKGENSFTFSSTRKVSESHTNARLTVAAYSAGKLIALDTELQSVDSGDSFDDFIGTLNIPDNTDLATVKVKVFVWGGLSGMEPVWVDFDIYPSAAFAMANNMNYIVYSNGTNFDQAELSANGKFQTLAISHGTLAAGENASYAYAILPNSSITESETFMSDPTVQIVAADSTQHTVKDLTTGAVLANIFAPATVNGIYVESPCSLILKESADSYIIDVSDPTQKLDTISFVFPEAIESVQYDGEYEIDGTRLVVQTKHTGETLHLVVC